MLEQTGRLGPILVTVTGIPSGQRALDRAIEVAERTGADLVAIVIHGRLPSIPTTVAEVDEERARAKDFFDAIGRLAVDQAAESGITLELQHEHGSLGRVLRRTIHEHRITLVVIGRPASWAGWIRTMWAVHGLRCSILLAA